MQNPRLKRLGVTMKESLKSQLHVDQTLPSIPQLALKIIKLISADELNFDEVVFTLKHDPALVTKIITCANSPAYGKPCHTDSINQAIVQLGPNAALQLALAFTLYESTTKQRYPKPLDVLYFWKRAVIAATAAKAMSTERKEQDILFVAALLQDVGVFVLADLYGNEYLQAIGSRQRKPIELCHAELLLFEATHADVAVHLLKGWHFPETIVQCIQHSDDLDGHLNNLEAIVAVSGWFADAWMNETDERYSDQDEVLLKALMEKLFNEKKIKIDELIATMRAAVPDIAKWFNLVVETPNEETIDSLSKRANALVGSNKVKPE